MPFCSKCGAKVLGAACQFCGKPVESTGAEPAPLFADENASHERDDVVAVDAEGLRTMKARLAELEEAQALEAGRRVEMIPLVSFTTTSQRKIETLPQICPGCGAPVSATVCKYCGRDLAAGLVESGPPAERVTISSVRMGLPDNVAGGLCYMLGPFTGAYFLVTEPYRRNPKVRFHALQSNYLSLSTLAAVFVLPFFGTLLQLLGPGVGSLFAGLWFLLYMAPFVAWMAVMSQAFSGKKLRLPIIGRLAEAQAG
jgi:uncharacterized membrane protein